MTVPEAEIPRAREGARFVPILVATVIAGVASYLVTWLVPRRIGLAEYAVFAVAWSAIYLVVGALSGIQQEVTRGTQLLAAGATAQVSRARNFGGIAAALMFIAVVASAPLWVRSVFPSEGWDLVWPLAVATASYVMVAVLAGSLYGVIEWFSLALMIGVDGLMRLATISVTLIFTTDVVSLAWAVALPFPFTIIVLWPYLRRRIVGRSQLDVGYRSLSWNVARTIVAAASTGIMVSGFPLLLGLASRGESRSIVGLFILTITLARAPLIVVAMSLQSYFIVAFRDRPEHFWRQFLTVIAIIVAGGVVLSAAGWLIGPVVFGFLFPGELRPGGWFIGVLVMSSVLVGTLCVTAPAVLARSQHFVYAAGWVAAAAVTLIVLFLPGDFTVRTVLSLVCGPVAGLIVHAAYLVTAGTRERHVITSV